MEMETMGRVTTEVTLENSGDLWEAHGGKIAPEAVRRVVIADALVDTGATLLSLPAKVIRELGLVQIGTKRVRTSLGMGEAGLFAAVRLTIEGRNCTIDALEAADDTPVLIGQIPLENLDFVVDLRNRRLIGNPAHGGEHMFELY